VKKLTFFATTAWGLGSWGPARRSGLAHTHEKGGGIQVLTSSKNLDDGGDHCEPDRFERQKLA